jgi:regulator of RNase E activity RraB
MIKYTQSFLDKIQSLLENHSYQIRHEKGNFKTGHCLKGESKIILINKLAPIEGKINFLCDVLRTVELDESLLDEESRQLIEHLNQTELKL